MLSNTFSKCPAKCPVCGYRFPLAFHLFFNDRAGIKCDDCNSLLGHSFQCKVFKIIFMFMGVGTFALSIDQENLIWLLPALIFSSIMIYLQRCSKFIIIFNSKQQNSR